MKAQTLAKLVEDKANGTAVIHSGEDPQALVAEGIARGAAKERRERVPVNESGNVHLPHPALFPWVEGSGQPEAFLRRERRRRDALTQALNWLFNRTSNLAAAMRAEIEREKQGGVRLISLEPREVKWKS